MRRLLLLVLFIVVLSPVASAAAGDDKEKIVKSTVMSEGKKRTYYLFVPEGVSKEKPAPLLVLLHGSGHNGKLLVEHWQKLAAQEGLILAGPDARSPEQWGIPQDGPLFLRDLVEELKKTQPVDPARVYLFGHSAGAIFGLYMTALESEYFAAVASSAGAMRDKNFEMLDEAERKIPVALFVGTRDPLFPVSVVRATRDAYKQRGFTVELTEVPNHDHNYYKLSTDINAKAWAFLKQHRLAGEARYKEHNFR
ncbi:MAG TPA: dienelactone hydrolase family protein [Pyrinomonadaceae bacterium]